MDNGITPLNPEQEKKQEAQTAKEGFVHRNLVQLDELGNTLIFDGKNDETISSHWARSAEEHHVLGEIGIHFLNIFQHNHGPKAQAGDVERAKAVEKLEEDSPGFTK